MVLNTLLCRECKCNLTGTHGPFAGQWQKDHGGGSSSKCTLWEAGHREVGIIRWLGECVSVLSEAASQLMIFCLHHVSMYVPHSQLVAVMPAVNDTTVAARVRTAPQCAFIGWCENTNGCALLTMSRTCVVGGRHNQARRQVGASRW